MWHLNAAIQTIKQAIHTKNCAHQLPYTSEMPTKAPSNVGATAYAKPGTRFRRWWSRLAPYRQDRFAVLAPLLAVMLFIAAIIAVFVYLRLEEIAREREALSRDLEYTQQRLRLRLLEQQEQFARLARELSVRSLSRADFLTRAESLSNTYKEIQGLNWIDQSKKVRWRFHVSSLSNDANQYNNNLTSNKDLSDEYQRLPQQIAPLYAPPRASDGHLSVLRLYLPIVDKDKFTGDLMVEYNVEDLYRYGIPSEMSSKYALSILDSDKNVLAGTITSESKLRRNLMPWANPINTAELEISPIGPGLLLRGQAYRTSYGVISSGMFWLVMVLSVVTCWLLLNNWRHTRKRVRAQDALVHETAFRRAMEESMLTGMRALDMDGRITFVNKAFCRMTGWTEEDLIGTTAPFPYWPEEDMETLRGRLQDELFGNVQPNGFQFRLKRKDGVLIDARIYVSPLVDAFGKQTGWMSSMTDITEPNRVRMQLAAAHERFTTVLEALDASISVGPTGSDELLFANKLYRLWFGTKAHGHLQLIADSGNTPKPVDIQDNGEAIDHYAGLPMEALNLNETESAELYLGNLGRWLEVRTRYLNWVDGRVAQMVIATDITARRMAEEQSELEAQRAQASSRLITMGEMASSVAHELNQPLTAINNYCNGMLSRIRSKQIDTESLLQALEKTAHQANRAGQIIQRIRAFVKRSEPNRSQEKVKTLVAEAMELAEIELRRRNVKLQQNIESDLPDVLVDPILIEQVLLNLIKNAAESIDSAKRSANQRLIQLTVSSAMVENKPAVEFVVKDNGPGISAEVMPRLYEAFYSSKAEGMGIGLSLCRSIVESHTGRMKAENLYNGEAITGCRFSFWLPAMTAAPATIYASPERDIDQVSP